MRFLHAFLIGTAALAVTGTARAGHQVIYAPTAKSFASAAAHQGPNVQGSTISITNATIDNQAVAPGGTVSHDPLSPTKNGVFVATPGGSGTLSFGSTASASADLGAGTLKTSVGAYGPDFFGSPLGFATATLSDTLYFTNNSGGDLSVTIRYSFDGTITDSNNSSGPGGQASLILSCDYFRCYNDGGAAIRFAESGTQVGDGINAYFDENGLSMFARNIYGDQYQLFDRFDVWQQSPYGSGGAIDGWMQATLLIPTGETSLGLWARLDLDCRGGSNCDFGHTGTLGFLDLPDGLGISSASGVFPIPAAPGGGGGGGGVGGVGGVPEPATWAMMILGFGLTGLAARRRSARVTA